MYLVAVYYLLAFIQYLFLQIMVHDLISAAHVNLDRLP